MAPGTPARLVCEWPNLNLGDVVHITKFDPIQGYLVRTNSNLDEIWLPAHVLSANPNNRKPWGFRFRKPSFVSHTARRSAEYQDVIAEVHCPEFIDKVKYTFAQSGSKVTFKCRLKQCGGNLKVSWRKMDPDPSLIRSSGRFVIGKVDGGVVTLTINNAKTADCGTYTCTISNEVGSTQCSGVLSVTDSLPPLQEPSTQVVSCSSVMLEWDSQGTHTLKLYKKHLLYPPH